MHCLRCGTELVARELEGVERWACPHQGCGHVHYDNPVPVVAAIVEHEGEVILVQNKGWPSHWFGIVSGFLERGETPEAAVLREVREELGLDARVEAWVGAYAFVERNQVLLVWHVVAEGTVVVGDELAAIRRVHPDGLRPWPMGTGPAVAAWLESRRRAAP